MSHTLNNSRSDVSPAAAAHCTYRSPSGRRCRLPRADSQSALCLRHAKLEQQSRDVSQTAAELQTLTGEFKTATDVNHVLGKLFTLLSNDRIPPRKGAVLAYVGQLIVQTLPGVKREIQNVQGLSAWDQTVQRALEREFALRECSHAQAGLPAAVASSLSGASGEGSCRMLARPKETA